MQFWFWQVFESKWQLTAELRLWKLSIQQYWEKYAEPAAGQHWEGHLSLIRKYNYLLTLSIWKIKIFS